MDLVGVSTRRTSEVTRAMSAGLPRHGYSVIPLDATTIPTLKFAVFHGMAPEEDYLREQLVQLGIPWLVLDLGYLGDRYATYQVGWGKIGWMPKGSLSPKRFHGLGIPIVNDRDKAGEWMLVGQVPGDNQHRCDEYQLRDLYVSILSRIKAGEPGAKVMFRGHPRAPQNLVKGLDVSFQIGCEVPLAEALKYARACVTINSTAYYEAAAAGVPVVCGGKAHYAPVCATFDLDGKDPIPFPRLRSAAEKVPQFVKASWAQWTFAEMRSGKALDFLLRFSPVPL